MARWLFALILTLCGLGSHTPTAHAHAGWATEGCAQAYAKLFPNAAAEAAWCTDMASTASALKYDTAMKELHTLADSLLGDQVQALKNLRTAGLTREFKQTVRAYNFKRSAIRESGLSEKELGDALDPLDFEIWKELSAPLRKAAIRYLDQEYPDRADTDESLTMRRWMDSPWFFLWDKETRLTTLACTYVRMDESAASQLVMCSRMDLETGQITGTKLEDAVREPIALKAYEDQKISRPHPRQPIPDVPFYRQTRDEFVQSELNKTAADCRAFK